VNSSGSSSLVWPTWSFDGAEVAFRGHSSGTYSIYKLTLGSGDLIALRAQADHPDWAP
jgi:hypothetical protein